MRIQNLFLNIVEISIMMSIIILAVCLFSPILQRKYIARWQYYIWFAITIRLLFPLPLSIPDAPIHINPGQVLQESTTWQAPFLSDIVKTDDIHNDRETEESSGKQSSFLSTSPLLKIGTVIWLAGIFAFLLYHLVGYFYFVRSNNRWSLEANPDQKALFTKVKAELGIRRKILLRQSQRVKSPLLYGIFKPIVVIPNVEYSETDLYLILKHELTHYKRHDIELKIILFIVRAFYWFNPFVHLMSKKFNETIEMICDEYVISGKDGTYKKRYMETILHSVEQQTQRPSIFTSNYNGGIKVVKKRFLNISLSGSKKKGYVALATFAVIFTASSSLVVFGSNGTDTNQVNKELSIPTNSEVVTPKTNTIADKLDGVYADQERNTALEKAIIDHFKIPREDVATTKYYYNYVDLDGDGKDEIITVVMGPYSSGSGGSTALFLTETKSGKMQLDQELTLIQTPIIISDKITNGYKEIIVMNSGGGAEPNYVSLTANNGKYTSVNDGTVIEGLEGISGTAIISNDISKDMDEGKALYLQIDRSSGE